MGLYCKKAVVKDKLSGGGVSQAVDTLLCALGMWASAQRKYTRACVVPLYQNLYIHDSLIHYPKQISTTGGKPPKVAQGGNNVTPCVTRWGEEKFHKN